MTDAAPGENKSVQQLHDRIEISDVLNRYADGIYCSDLEKLMSCFADDSFLDYGHSTMRGVQEIRRFFSSITERHARGEQRLSTPVITNVTITLDGSEAHCESMCLAIHIFYGDDTKVTVRGTRNIDDFIRTASGWKIRERRHEQLWSFETPGTYLGSSGTSH